MTFPDWLLSVRKRQPKGDLLAGWLVFNSVNYSSKANSFFKSRYLILLVYLVGGCNKNVDLPPLTPTTRQKA